ncbi:hypothetical protein SSX86_004097 [Deinandra increscens subsp. villosa]|uniref:RING-type domain-containing protein n=1 Tax=Deinandra increscens subsp. villosa TaxID=3103831 RepID=A0AAP0DML6_9ASTR
MPFLYYGLVVVATAAIILAVYNLIIVRWCATRYYQGSRHQTNHLLLRHRRNSTTNVMIVLPHPPASFRYAKDDDQLDYETECCVCLSVFEEGEELRKLDGCNHSFHASCIDMWLFSHLDCPLCRAPVPLLNPPV